MVGERISSGDMQAVNEVMMKFDHDAGYLSGFYKNFLGGEEVRDFEKEFAEYIGVKYAIAVTCGTAALHTAILAAMGGNGMPVPCLTTPYTFAASASAILMAGGIPIFGDISSDTLNLDPMKAKASLDYQEPRIIIAVHLLGQPMNIESLRYRFPRALIIEDCAQALGATFRGQKTGSLGQMGCFSFQETKTLTTLGEGGMITTNSDGLAEFCRNIRNHGEKYGKKPYLGYNYRMTEAAAAFGRSQLRRLDKTLKQQIECAKIVRENLPKFLEPLKVPSSTKPVFFLVGTKTKDEFIQREKFASQAQERLFHDPPAPGKSIGIGYTELIPDLPLYQTKMHPPKIPVAREMIKRSVWFDIHRFTNEEVVKERMEQLRKLN